MAGGFEALGLAPELVRAVTEDLGYLLPTNVQVFVLSSTTTQVHHSSRSRHHARTAEFWGGVRPPG